jgi:hypothetical protein
MFGLTAALTRSGHVVRALAAAGVIGAAACQDASRAVGPTKDVGEANALFLAAPQPDLIVKSFTYAPIDPNYPGYAWSTDVELTAVVSNVGLATAGASILSFSGWAPATLQPLSPVLSTSSPWLACTMPLRDGQFWVPALAPGQDYIVHWTVHLQDGSYYQITATANSPQCTSEWSVSNNSALVHFQVIVIN